MLKSDGKAKYYSKLMPPRSLAMNSRGRCALDLLLAFFRPWPVNNLPSVSFWSSFVVQRTDKCDAPHNDGW